MKNLFFLILVSGLAFIPLWAQTPANQATPEASDFVFAVGQAQLEKEKLTFAGPLSLGLNSTAKKALEEWHELFLNDFSFYKKIFEIKANSDLSEEDFRKAQAIDKSGPGQFKIQLLGREGSVEVSLLNLKDGKEIFYTKADLTATGLRQRAHKVADELYEKITGKKSIFNSQIVFVSDNESRGKRIIKELYLMDFDGKNLRKLTNHRSIVISPAMSYDKTKVVYSLIDYKRKKRNIDLHLMDLSTGKNEVISAHSGLNSGAVFLPGDKEIALTLSPKGNADIFVMDLKTKSTRPLTTSSGEDVDPSFSADGRRFAFLSDRSGKAMVYTASPGATEKQVSRVSYVGQFNATPRFSPKGDEISFASWVDNRFDIYKVSSDSNKLERLTKNFGSNEDPSYSPDGEFILFSSQRILSSVKAVQNLYIMGRDGDIIGAVLEDFGNCSSPRWSN